MKLYLYRFVEAGKDTWHEQTEVERDGAERVRSAFVKMGGKPALEVPFHAILGREWEDFQQLSLRYYNNPVCVRIPVVNTMADFVSFTYGPSAKENAQVYTLNTIALRLRESTWPQDCVRDGAPEGMPRYIEAQIWKKID